MKVNDAVPGAILIAFAAGVLYQTLSFPPMPGQDYGPALFPQIIGILMVISGLALVVRGLRTRRGSGAAGGPTAGGRMLEVADWMQSPAHLANFALLIALLIFYILVAKPLGFIPTSFLVLAALMTRLRGLRHLGSSLAIAAVATLAIQQMFGVILRVPLPWGILPPVSW
ncbi:putative tricarboxylic transport membrane protein [Tistlia consotensis]|uniref:Putative tricarboxylic transport membrane protein n=1 Tax=Tistlia consotensis USBA 355 TaxID=560819 RepID=A0A1Y6BQ34_9PROT|nr:tripartite tricarboxylate transporter TctB family protein [Tistlia consotensis]SMF13987.1 putative tricarboxylic transport membrane protein [Tistlia consotensis USBA 355]SNR49991.1 putative tricarboxylic transport membrane protein [Tistlia consotensis]